MGGGGEELEEGGGRGRGEERGRRGGGERREEGGECLTDRCMHVHTFLDGREREGRERTGQVEIERNLSLFVVIPLIYLTIRSPVMRAMQKLLKRESP